MPDDLYGLGRLNDPDGSTRPDDSDGLSGLDDLDRLSRPDYSNRLCQTTHTDEAGLILERANGPKDSDGLGWVGPTIWTGRARRPVRTKKV